MLTPVVGQVILVVYAILLGVGGYIGFRKAGSKASLRAGISTAIATLVCSMISINHPVTGFWAGAGIGVLMMITFGSRFAKTRKFMPAGMLGILSLAVVIAMALVDKGA